MWKSREPNLISWVDIPPADIGWTRTARRQSTDLGFPAGKELGACLDYLLSCVVEETLPNDKIALAAAALRWRQEHKMEE